MKWILENNRIAIVRILFLLIILMYRTACAGPPYISDDPEVTEYHHYELYLFSSLDKNNMLLEEPQLMGPALEGDWGVIPNGELHLIVPYVWALPIAGVPAATGIGDAEVGVKYRFIQEGKLRPQITFAPLLELPLGNSTFNLGNGQTWLKVPIWVKKKWGAWSADVGGGYAFNSALGMRDYPYGGFQVQGDINDSLSIGAEIFSQGAITVQSRAATIIDLGATCNLTKQFSVLFSVGHSVIGEEYLVAYFGLYWTGG